MTQAEKMKAKIQELENEIRWRKMSFETWEQERDSCRHPIVCLEGDEPLQSYRYSINPDNGYATIGFMSEGQDETLVFRHQNWAPHYLAEDIFGPLPNVKHDEKKLKLVAE